MEVEKARGCRERNIERVGWEREGGATEGESERVGRRERERRGRGEGRRESEGIE